MIDCRQSIRRCRTIPEDSGVFPTVRNQLFSFSYSSSIRAALSNSYLIKNAKSFIIPNVAFILFFLGSVAITNYRPYAVLVIVYVGLLFYISHNLTAAVWQGFVGTLLFYKAKYFIVPFVSELAVRYGLDALTPFVYFVTFADVLLIVLFYLLLRQRDHHPNFASKPLLFLSLSMALLLCIGALSSVYSHFPEVSWFGLARLAQYFVIFFLALHIFKDRFQLLVTASNILIFVVGNSLLILLQKIHKGPLGLAIEDFSSGSLGRFSDENTSLYRPGGIYFDPNLPATLVTLFLPLTMLIAIKYSPKSYAYALPFFVLLGALFSTASRANWIVALVSVLITLLLIPRKIMDERRAQLKRIGMVLVIGMFSQVGLLVDRLASLAVAMDESGGVPFRLRHLQIAYQFMISHPLGVGIDVFQYQILQRFNPSYYFYHFTSAHNILAEVAAGLGVFGLLLYLLMQAKIVTVIIISVLHHKRLINQGRFNFTQLMVIGLGLGYVSYLASAMFFPWLFAPPLSEVAWLVLAMLYTYSRIDLLKI